MHNLFRRCAGTHDMQTADDAHGTPSLTQKDYNIYIMTISKKLPVIALLAISLAPAWAAPAKPGLIKHRQPDGTVINIRLCGDEFFHYYETEDGILLHKDKDGCMRYAAVSHDNRITASKYAAQAQDKRTPEALEYIRGTNRTELKKIIKEEHLTRKTAANRQPGSIQKSFPTTGEVKGLVILAEYQDVKFSGKATQQDFDRLMNEDHYSGELAFGSVKDYFKSQSDGKLDIHFDVVGPVTLSKDRAYYGSEANGREKVDEMAEEACILADNGYEIDFSEYDSNNDGFVDFIYIIYAGHGQAQGGPEESVWPQSSSLEYSCWKTFDGMYLGKYSCSCELRGADGNEIDGIGTFCHEFSHILGLPDIYDPVYSGFDGLGHWDVMDVGSYNDDSKTPAGYTAMDKYTLGWLEPTVLESHECGITLKPLSEANEAYFIVSEHDANEYYTLENRQNTGWDSALPGHGLIICHIHYDAGLWASNRVNTSSSKYEHVKLIAADGKIGTETEAGDAWPGTTGNSEFTDTSSPASVWHNGEKTGKPIRNITEHTDGTVSFDFISQAGLTDTYGAGTDEMRIMQDKDGMEIITPGKQAVSIYALSGTCIDTYENEYAHKVTLPKGVYIIKSRNTALKFAVN